MFQFQHINYLYTLAIIPLLVVLFFSIVYWRKRKLQKLGNEQLMSEQIQGYIPGRNTFKFILLAIALSSIIIGWANLRMGDKTEKAERKGVDVVIALDVSKSMLAKDIQPDRLTRAKQLIMRLTDKMKNDRVALIVFAGKSYMQVPLTIDYSSVKMILQNVSPDVVPTQGTVVSEAITMGMESFARNERKFKSLIVISDGEDHDEKAVEVAQKAADEGVIIHTVGVGSPQGSTLYDPETKSVKLDENGDPVISKLNEEALKSVSRAGRGTYSLLQNTDEVAEKLNNALESMEQKNLGSLMFTDFTSYFQYFLIVGFLLLFIEWLLPGAKRKSKVKTTGAVSAGIILLLLAATTANAQVTRNIQKGNSLYGQQKYNEAAADYAKVVAKNPNYTPGLFNLGTTLYQQKKYDSSRKWLERTEKVAKDKDSKSAANYNIGNTYMSQQKWEEAINSYKRTLRNNPQDADAKYNLSYAEQMLKKQQQENKDKKDKEDKKDNKDDKDKQNKQDKKDDKDKDKQDKNDPQDKDKKEDKQDEQKPQSQPSKLSQQQAEQLLNALQQEEKKLQDKMKKEKGVPVKMQKDW